MLQDLGLDEALVTVNKSIIQEPIDVYYQIEECFGCPLEKLKTLIGTLEDRFVIGSKFKLQLELQNGGANESSPLCRFNGLDLNNHEHYRIDLEPADGKRPPQLASSSSYGNKTSQYDCLIRTVAEGDCYLCPIAMLLTLLFVITVCEQVYSKFLFTKKGKSKRRVSDNGSRPIDEQQLPVSSESQETSDGVLQEQGQARELQSSSEQQTIEQGSTTREPKPTKRVESLDAFRGLTIAGMIMVNYGGAGYTFLEHKPWDGLTLADLVFPFFIFSMGASVAISLRSQFRCNEKTLGQILSKIFRRSFILMTLGICLNSKWLDNTQSFDQLRLTGVLQRFSISYLVVGVMYSVELALNKWIKSHTGLYRAKLLSKLVNVFIESLTALNFLALYLYLTFFFEYSDSCPVGYVGPGGQTELGHFANCTGGAAAWLDRLILGSNHLYHDRELKTIFKTSVSHDPEGILGTSTSILLTIIGLQCGKILAKYKNHRRRLFIFLQWIVILSMSCAAIIFIPINKRLWSFTFVTVTALAAYLLITTLYLLMDVYQCERTLLIRLLISAGKNSIFLYVGHSLLSNMLPWHFSVNESSHLQLLFRLTWATFVWLLVAHYLARKRLFIKI